MSGHRDALKRLAAIVADWAPTDFLVPSISDTHPDHSALAVMLRLVWSEYFLGNGATSVWSYVVHGKSPAFFDRAETVRQTAAETATKFRAISCHKTQLKLSRKRFLGHAGRPERLVKLSRWETIRADGPITLISRQLHSLSINLQRSPKPMRPRKPALFILGHDEAVGLRCARMQVPIRF